MKTPNINTNLVFWCSIGVGLSGPIFLLALGWDGMGPVPISMRVAVPNQSLFFLFLMDCDLRELLVRNGNHKEKKNSRKKT